jgi:hypothetical protein
MVASAINSAVKITHGPYRGYEGTMVFSKTNGFGNRYYVIELMVQCCHDGAETVIVYNGEFDFLGTPRVEA